MDQIFGIPTAAFMGQLMLGLVNGSFYALLSLGLAVIFGLLKEMIIEKLDKFMIFPAVVVKKLPKTDFTVAVDLNLLDVDDQELFVGAAVDIKELKTPTVPVPKYVANRNPIRKEVHRCDCISVQRMDESNKVGYYTLYEAFKDGYDGCKKCIPEYHTR